MELSKFQHIRINGHSGRWSAFDSYVADDGSEYIILSNDRWGNAVSYLVCRVTSDYELELICDTYSDIETALTSCEIA